MLHENIVSKLDALEETGRASLGIRLYNGTDFKEHNLSSISALYNQAPLIHTMAAITDTIAIGQRFVKLCVYSW